MFAAYVCMVLFFLFEMAPLIRIVRHRCRNNQEDENKHLFVSASNKSVLTLCLSLSPSLSRLLGTSLKIYTNVYVQMRNDKEKEKTNCNTFNHLICVYLNCNSAVYTFFSHSHSLCAIFISLCVCMRCVYFSSFYRSLVVEIWWCWCDLIWIYMSKCLVFDKVHVLLSTDFYLFVSFKHYFGNCSKGTHVCVCSFVIVVCMNSHW